MADLNPCSSCVAQAAYTKMLLGTHLTDWSNTYATRMRFLGENLRKFTKVRPSQEISGDLWVLSDRVTDGQTVVWGTVYFAMNPEDMEILLPYMIGDKNTGSGGTGYFEPDTCRDDFHLLIQRDHGIFRATYCQIIRFRIESRALQFMEDSNADMVVLAVDIIARDMDLNQVSWPDPEPTLGTGATYAPYYFKYCTISIQGSTRYIERVKLTVDHRQTPRYRNSTTPVSICSRGRNVLLGVRADWNSTNNDMYEQSAVDAGYLRFANSDASLFTKFMFGHLKEVPVSPYSPSKESDVIWDLSHIGVADDPSAGTYDIYVENDKTP